MANKREVAVSNTPPVAFVSYSWVNQAHRNWVIELSRRLRANGVDVRIDEWDVVAGKSIEIFMEQYADENSYVLVVLSDDYADKADKRDERPSGVGTETAIVSSTIYRNLSSGRVIPIVPDTNTVEDEPKVPVYLSGRKWIDFRSDCEESYEDLLRALHQASLEPAPPLGPNPFSGRTDSQARAMIRNSPERWRSGGTEGEIRVNLNENSGKFVIGLGEAEFSLWMDYPYGGDPHPGAPSDVRHYSDYIGKIGLVRSAKDHLDRFEDLSSIPLSNRIERTKPGDAIVMLNEHGYWGLLMHDDLIFEDGPNGFEPIAVMRFKIARDRSSRLSPEHLPLPTATR